MFIIFCICYVYVVEFVPFYGKIAFFFLLSVEVMLFFFFSTFYLTIVLMGPGEKFVNPSPFHLMPGGMCNSINAILKWDPQA